MTVPPLVRRSVVRSDGRSFHLYGGRDADPGDRLLAFGSAPDRLERRFDALTGAWVLISPSRNVRPSATTSGADAPACPLCPGGGELPTAGYEVAVFDNRYPSLAPDAPAPTGPLLAPARGRCEVIVYTADHVRTIAELSAQQLAGVIAVLRDRTAALWEDGYAYVMAFENHGSEVGATLGHLHGQIYALDHVPPVIATKRERHIRHREETGACLGCALVEADRHDGRTLVENDHIVAAVPFAPSWPFEVHVRAKQHGVGRLADLSDAAALDLGRALADVVSRYDQLWGFELPYMMCVQESPGADGGDWHLHVELIPPHRNADRLKVRASVETALGVFINDTIPEESAALLVATTPPPVEWDGVAIPAIEPAR